MGAALTGLLPTPPTPAQITKGLSIWLDEKRGSRHWRDAPAAYGPHKTLYNRWKRWSEAGVFIRMMEGLSGAQTERRTVMIDATYLKAHRTASSLRVKKGVSGD